MLFIHKKHERLIFISYKKRCKTHTYWLKQSFRLRPFQ